MNNVVFLVKNGIGFGHLRRALILAEALLDAGQVRPFIISQASSLALFEDTRVPVVNFPLLHRVPSAVAEDWYTAVLDRLLDRLDPAVVIEDTYPDSRYAALPSLADRPRLLVLRRLDATSFDTIRSQGSFARYDLILIAQDRGGFDGEGHSVQTRTVVQTSGRFRLVGPIYHQPTAQDVQRVRAMYPSRSGPLIVVNGGAGGDQMPDGYGDRLFHAMQAVAARLDADGLAAHLIFVTGPYYAGRPLTQRANVTIRRYEPNLHALLAIADIVVVKPGNNVLSEALSGTCHLILVPDVSFMEGLDEHSRRVVAEYGGQVARPDVEELEPLVRKALTAPRREKRLTARASAAIQEVVSTVHHLASDIPPTIEQAKLCLITDSDHRTQPAAALTATTVVATPGPIRRFQHHVQSVFARRRCACVRLDLRRLSPDDRDRYDSEVRDWLARQPVQLISLDEYRQIVARALLEKR